jgi:hypothetical protein
MNYKIEYLVDKKQFAPFRVTLDILTEEDFVRFHDKLATFLTQGPSDFIKDVYNFGRGWAKYESAEGPI